MSHTAPTVITRLVDRARERAQFLAPKLIAFLASGLSVSAVLAVLASLNVHMDPVLATILVGGVSTVAAYIQRDNLLGLAPGQFSLKVIAFLVTSASATGIVATAAQLGIDLSQHTVIIGVALTVIASLFGFAKSDRVAVDLRDVEGVPDVSSLS